MRVALKLTGSPMKTPHLSCFFTIKKVDFPANDLLVDPGMFLQMKTGKFGEIQRPLDATNSNFKLRMSTYMRIYIYIWVFPKIGVSPKWMVYNGKPY